MPGGGGACGLLNGEGGGYYPPMRMVLLLVAGLVGVAPAATWYVDDVTDPDEDGSFLHPFDQIQQALDVAAPGDTISVRSGTYRGDGNKHLDFQGKPLTLESGFGPTQTTIDCEGVGRAFHFHSGETTASVIRGFTISGANTAVVASAGAEGEPYWERAYGTHPSAILCESNSGFRMENCVIRDSQAMTNQTLITIGLPGFPDYTQTLLTDGDGGALRCRGGHVVLQSTRIENNRAGFHGGGIAVDADAVLDLRQVTLMGNVSGLCGTGTILSIGTVGNAFYQLEQRDQFPGCGGGLYAEAATISLDGCVLVGNSAGQAGGGVCITQCAPLLVTGCVFQSNGTRASEPGGRGGGLAVHAGIAEVADTLFVGNASIGPRLQTVVTIGDPADPFYQQTTMAAEAGRGGGCFAAGGSAVGMAGCLLEENVAGVAGGALAAVDGATIRMTNCIIRRNRATDARTPARGGGLAIADGTLLLTDSVVADQEVGGGLVRTVITIGTTIDPFHQQTVTDVSQGVGGGIALHRSSGLVQRCVFRGNASAEAGAISLASNAVLALRESSFIGNRATQTNMTVQTVETVETVTGILTFCTTILRNGGGLGGALGLRESACAVERCVFASNSATFGGALAPFASTSTWASTVFRGNDAGMESTWQTVSNAAAGTFSVLSSNRGSPGAASVLWLADGVVAMTNCTWWRNAGSNVFAVAEESTNAHVGLVNGIVWSNHLDISWTGVVAAAASFIEGGWLGPGNRDEHPELTPSGRLRADSPCIDRGLFAGAPLLDFEGEPRVDHPDHPNDPSVVDVGADEFVDADGDGLADGWELSEFTNTSAAGASSDFDGDGLSDVGEYELGAAPRARDSDGDGMADGWELEHQLDLLGEDATRDPDLDGFSNGQEYVADTDPTNGLAYLYLIAETPAGAAHAPAVCWPASARRHYTVEGAVDPGSGWLPLLTLPGTGGVQLVELDPATTLRVFRVQARLP